jgi:hypothetical protein
MFGYNHGVVWSVDMLAGCGRLVLCILLLVTGSAHAAGVVAVYGAKITVYKDHKGSGKLATLNRADLALPVPVVSFESEYGLIQVEFRFKGDARAPLIGWVRKRSVKLDERVEINVSQCASPSRNQVVVTRGTRGLGDRCP